MCILYLSMLSFAGKTAEPIAAKVCAYFLLMRETSGVKGAVKGRDGVRNYGAKPVMWS